MTITAAAAIAMSTKTPPTLNKITRRFFGGEREGGGGDKVEAIGVDVVVDAVELVKEDENDLPLVVEVLVIDVDV